MLSISYGAQSLNKYHDCATYNGESMMIDRAREKHYLQEVSQWVDAQLIAVYGRRRVDNTSCGNG